jgi:hypothetical protein
MSTCNIQNNIYKGSFEALTMGYFDDLDNGLLHKYQKILKIEKSLLVYSFTYYRFIVCQILSNFIII